jgi:hypothetical protein
VGVYVSSSHWTPGYYNTLAAAGVGDATLGYALAGGAGQLGNANTPDWINLDTISVVFSEPVSGVSLTSLALGDSGNNGGPSSGISVSGESNPSPTVATFTLSGPLSSNKYYLDLAAAGITDAAGAALDGEWTSGASTFAAGSGDGAPGGDFVFRFNVLAGDVNRDGKVSGSDVTKLRTITLGTDTAAEWQYDVNGDNKISGADVTGVRSRPLVNNISSFPEPVLPSAGPIVSSDTAGSSPSMAFASAVGSPIAGSAVATAAFTAASGVATATPAVPGPVVKQSPAGGGNWQSRSVPPAARVTDIVLGRVLDDSAIPTAAWTWSFLNAQNQKSKPGQPNDAAAVDRLLALIAR